MKKLLTYLYLLCLLAIADRAHAQISVGAKAGVNLNQFQQPGTTFGLNAGLYASYKINSFLGVRFEPHYSQEGGGRPDYERSYAQISDNIRSIQYLNPSVRFHNVQLPILFELTLPDLADQTVMPVLLIGGSYGMTVAAFEQHISRYRFNDYTGPITYAPGSITPPDLDVSYQRDNVGDNYVRSQWNLWFGMGAAFKTGERTFTIDVRYRHGLNNLNQLRFASPGNGVDTGVPGTGGNLRSSSVSINFSMSIFNF